MGDDHVPDPRATVTAYDAAFYADQVDGSLRSARGVLPVLYGVFRPESVVDVGCGQGAWLAAAEELGSSTLTGLDGDWVDPRALRSARMTFRPTDLRGPIAFDRRHDLCISMEVAEHLPAARAEEFVGALCAASDLVLFSAAVPRQGGTEHVNEERASRWIARFAARGYDCFDLIRGAVWEREDIAWWYRQNALLFAARGSAAHRALGASPSSPPPRDLVHPEAFEQKLAWAEAERDRLRDRIERPSLAAAMRGFWRALTRPFRRVVRPGRDA